MLKIALAHMYFLLVTNIYHVSCDHNEIFHEQD